MKIAIIGAGNVGGALGTNWAQKGHDIFFGVRDPNSEKAQALLRTIGAKARAATVADAIEAAALREPYPRLAQLMQSLAIRQAELRAASSRPTYS